jgi:hypothetical protein
MQKEQEEDASQPLTGVEAKAGAGNLGVKPAVLAQINPTGLSDVPTDRDGIGFGPYVRAISWFLSSEKTKPPLTMSIEGRWGSGKSSFMLQLENELRKQNTAKRKQYYVKFNAWRSDKDEALWAAFALTFIKQLEPQIDVYERVYANLTLLCKRFEWTRAWFPLARLVIFLIALLIFTIFALNNPMLTDPTSKTVLVGIPWLAAAYYGLEKAKKVLGNPLSYDLSKYVRNLKYEDKVAFVDRFHDDFADIVKSYVGNDGRVFVFIDDLDRCEVPRAAELLQAINLLLSADQGNLFFILGLDREMVAAGIAAKNEKILPYLAAGRAPPSIDKPDYHRSGIDYGYRFMEKFVQVPFRVPCPAEREITHWVSELTDASAASGQESTMPSGEPDPIDIRAGSDPDGFEETTKKIAQLFGFNPRRLKQFINVFRLRVMIAISTGVLAPARQSSGGMPAHGGITIHQLGQFTAILMRWSPLAGDLVEEPTLLDKLLVASEHPSEGIVAKWLTDNELRKAITLDQTYSLSAVDLRPLLMIMPNAYSGMLGERDPKQARTRLVAVPSGQVENPSPTQNPSPTSNTSPTLDGLPPQQTITSSASGGSVSVSGERA